MAQTTTEKQSDKAKATLALAEKLARGMTGREAWDLVRELDADASLAETVKTAVAGAGAPSRRGQDSLRRQLVGPKSSARATKPVPTSAKAASNDNPMPAASAFAPGPRGLALLRGQARLETLLAEAGGTFDQDQVQTLLHGISRQAIDKRVREGSLLSVPGPNGARRYPVCQFLSEGGLLKGLKEVQAALPARGPWSGFLFLMMPHSDLQGRKPLEVLREGKLDLVIAAAYRLGQQGS